MTAPSAKPPQPQADDVTGELNNARASTLVCLFFQEFYLCYYLSFVVVVVVVFLINRKNIKPAPRESRLFSCG